VIAAPRSAQGETLFYSRIHSEMCSRFHKRKRPRRPVKRLRSQTRRPGVYNTTHTATPTKWLRIYLTHMIFHRISFISYFILKDRKIIIFVLLRLRNLLEHNYIIKFIQNEGSMHRNSTRDQSGEHLAPKVWPPLLPSSRMVGPWVT
jgi:hypothetical protein